MRRTVVTRTMSAACERDESAFILVQAVARFELPFWSVLIASAALVTVSHLAPST